MNVIKILTVTVFAFTFAILNAGESNFILHKGNIIVYDFTYTNSTIKSIKSHFLNIKNGKIIETVENGIWLKGENEYPKIEIVLKDKTLKISKKGCLKKTLYMGNYSIINYEKENIIWLYTKRNRIKIKMDYFDYYFKKNYLILIGKNKIYKVTQNKIFEIEIHDNIIGSDLEYIWAQFGNWKVAITKIIHNNIIIENIQRGLFFAYIIDDKIYIQTKNSIYYVNIKNLKLRNIMKIGKNSASKKLLSNRYIFIPPDKYYYIDGDRAKLILKKEKITVKLAESNFFIYKDIKNWVILKKGNVAKSFSALHYKLIPFSNGKYIVFYNIKDKKLILFNKKNLKITSCFLNANDTMFTNIKMIIKNKIYYVDKKGEQNYFSCYDLKRKISKRLFLIKGYSNLFETKNKIYIFESNGNNNKQCIYLIKKGEIIKIWERKYKGPKTLKYYTIL